jgi:hypothetical protein
MGTATQGRPGTVLDTAGARVGARLPQRHRSDRPCCLRFWRVGCGWMPSASLHAQSTRASALFPPVLGPV